MSKEREEILNEMKEKYKIALFMVIRNSQVMPLGIKLGKSKKEINKMLMNLKRGNLWIFLVY